MKEIGLIHVYTGNGKGKTTAAIGLCIRAVGAGLQVLFVQFMKSRPTSELDPLEALGVQVFRREKSPKFLRDMTDEEKTACAQAQHANFAYAVEHAKKYDLVVLDEVICAVGSGMLSLDGVLAFLENKPIGLEIVLTGRDASEAIRDKADYVSHIHALKHPYQKGVQARKGIEF